MKQLHILIPLILILASCSTVETNTQPTNLLDFSSEKDFSLTEKYWTLDKTQEPIYPISSAIKGISGCVKMTFLINEQGKVENLKITSAYPARVFDRSALRAIFKWKWVATKENSAKQAVLTSYQLDFMVSEASNSEEAIKNCGAKHLVMMK